MKIITSNTGAAAVEFMLPAKNVDLAKWPVVACDQYTSEPEYWAETAKITGKEPSTLNLIYPEAYLNEDAGRKAARISAISAAMKEYAAKNILVPLEPCVIYVDRKTSHAASRKGLVMAVDLDKYDFGKGSQSPIRATEKTVVERIPPRLAIREKASIELSHIMLLIDDPERTVIEPVAAESGKFEKLYDVELMQKGGHIKGFKVSDKKALSRVFASLEKLADKASFAGKYGVGADKGVLLFAVGDGNHSLATAKTHWENVKKYLNPNDITGHPARYAMVEVVNVHDEGLKFEPIHRVVFNVKPEELLAAFREYAGKPSAGKRHVIRYVSKAGNGEISVSNPRFNLEVGTLQDFLDKYAAEHKGAEIDYIHGDDVVRKLSSKDGNIGFYLSAMDKSELFRTVILDGTLPRKTFSMGEAEEKRYYMECRKIV